MAARAPIKKAPPPPPAGNKPSGSGKKTGDDKKVVDKKVVDTTAIDAANARIKALEDDIAAGKTEDEKDALRLQQERELLEAEKKEKAKSIYDTVTSELTRLGLSSLIDPLKRLFESGITDGESLRLALSQTEQYQTRFSANAKRIAAGLSALSPAEYIQLEDQYQNVM